jgi:hypothetical protein
VRIWFPLAILLSVGWLLLVAVVISRGDDGAGTAAPVAGDTATLLRQSQAAMLELGSFQFEMTSPWEGREYTYRAAWQSPDSFHVLSPYVTARYETGKDPVIEDHGFIESVAVGDRVFARPCAEENGDCQPWVARDRNGMYMPASTGELDPRWPIEVLGLMSNARVTGQDDVDGVLCTRIRGEANIMQAMIRSWRHAEEIRGPLDWGEGCTATATEPGGETEEVCHSFTLDEYIAARADSVPAEYESGPLPVEVWIGVHDRQMRRFELLQGAPLERFVAASFTFSRFDEVTVEPPK